MMLLVTFLMGMAGVTTAYQRTTGGQWTPNTPVNTAHFNRIDFRYPDWVVSPRPPCLSEGTFPHPRSSNCTWYYRCSKAAFGPRFMTHYFECEPGTQFDDDLDQCVHPHSGYNCQGVSTPTPRPLPPPDVCNILYSSCASYDSCQAGKGRLTLCRQEECTISGVKDKCFGGRLWDLSADYCVEKPRCDDCYILESSCQKIKSCDGSRTHHLCQTEGCTPSGIIRDKCSYGLLWDMDAKECVVKPVYQCEDIDIGTKCTAIDCKKMQVCTGGQKYEQTLCKKEECYRDGTYIGVFPMCPNSINLWDVKLKRCVAPPPANTCDCDKTATNCWEYDLCNPSGLRRLCDCAACPSGELYDPSTKQCISKMRLCPVLDCVFRDSVCSCVNGDTLCTACFLRGNEIPVSDFCTAQTNPYFYHVEDDTCVYGNSGIKRDYATNGHCPQLRGSLPYLSCSLRNNNIIRCWSDDV